jgi:hypothetical protein
MSSSALDNRVARTVALSVAAVLSLVLALDWFAAGGVDGLLRNPLKLGATVLAVAAYVILSVTADSAFEG